MDARTFDRLIAEAARPSRRGALRLAAAALVGGVFASRHLAPAAAQRPDSDGDGLYDDDETGVYGTDPNRYDTDGDGIGDGEEVYYGSNPLSSESAAGLTGNGNDVSLGAGPPADEVVIQQNPPPEGEVVGNGNDVSLGGSGVGDAGSVICYEIGTPCDYDAQCCNIGAVLCCWDGVSLRTECRDVTAFGGACPS
jgi:Bacterial TSP3 repeat